jgi:hypothetical protein
MPRRHREGVGHLMVRARVTTGFVPTVALRAA